MNKDQFAERLIQEHGMNLRKGEAKKLVAEIFAALVDELMAGNAVSISGFGKFSVKQMKERNGVNPSTGASIVIAAKKVVKLSVAKALKEAVNQ
jgi:DNA-binding protein HU-beta